MSKINTILFDLDGTLADNGHLYRQALEASLQNSGVAGFTREQVSNLLESKTLTRDLRTMGIDAALARRIEEERDESVCKLFSTCTDWMPGAEAFLQAASLQVSMGLVTNTWAKFIDAIDDRLHLRQYFPIIIAGEAMKGKYKPDPFGISLALAQLGASPEQAVYIGNDTSDMIASVRAGVRGIFISDKGECSEAYLHVHKWAELSLGDLLED